MGRPDASRFESLVPEARFDVLADLGGSDRSTVSRLAMVRAGRSTTVVAKEYMQAGEGYVREAAALAALAAVTPEGAEAPAPRWIADDGAPPVVLMSDLGPGGDLAERLLGRDPDAATAAVRAWARAAARVHVASSGAGERFAAELGARAGALPVDPHSQAEALRSAAAALAELAARLGVTAAPGALETLAGLADALPGSSEVHRLSPGDTCPDNNRLLGDRAVLLDFEAAQWRHPAWDVAYLTVPWPTCWCSWRMPDAVAQAGIEAYRTAAGPALPFVETDAFEAAVAAAGLGWALETTARTLGRALDDDRPPPWPTPRRRTVILHRLALAAALPDRVEWRAEPRSAELSGLAGLAGLARLAAGLRAALVDRWGEAELPLARAYR